MHIFNGLGSLNEKVNSRIKELLDFDSQISDEERLRDLEKIIGNKILETLASVSTEHEIYNELKKSRTLNDIPLVVKEYFNIPT